jgi:hypothetical protein
MQGNNYYTDSSGVPVVHAVPVGAPPNHPPNDFNRQPSAPMLFHTPSHTPDYTGARQFMTANNWPHGMQVCIAAVVCNSPYLYVIIRIVCSPASQSFLFDS